MKAAPAAAVVAAGVLTTAGVWAAAPAAAQNAPIVVTTTADVLDAGDGQTSLREAFALATSTAGEDVIQLAASQTYLLTLCDEEPLDAADLGGSLDHLAESDALTIQGAGATIQGGTTCPDRVVVSESAGLLTLEQLTVTGGRDNPEDHHGLLGGGVFAAGDVHGTGVDLLDNRTELVGIGLSAPSSGGGGLFAGGDVTLVDSHIAENVSTNGGGVRGRDVTLVDSVVRDNQARSGGGVVARNLTIENTQVFGNSSGFGLYRQLTFYYPGGGLAAAEVRVLDGSVVYDNRSIEGGAGIHSSGDVTIEDSVVRDNVADGLSGRGLGPCDVPGGGCRVGPQYGDTIGRGAGVHGGGDVTVRRSTIAGNRFDPGATEPVPTQATGHPSGAGVFAMGNVLLEDTSIWGNQSLERARHGGVRALGDLTVRNSTVSGNRAEDGSGGALSASGVLRLHHATVIRNAAPDGANIHAQGRFSLTRSVISAGRGGPACRLLGGTFTGGYNVTQGGRFGGRCGIGQGPGDRPLVQALGLGPLEDNGGPTFTHLPVGARLSVIPLAACTTTVDQRGEARPEGPRCEAGSVEIP